MQRLSDPYRLLGVGRDATAVEIKAAHRRLAKRLHPDRAQGDPDAFLAVQDAYELLSDPLRRREWDRRHAPGPVPAGQSPPTARDARARAPERPSRPAQPRAGAARPASARPATEAAAGSGASGETREGPGRRARTARPPDPSAAPDPDPFSRSSGAAWSSASRAFFRRTSADMPSGAANPNTPRWTTPLGATPPPRYAHTNAQPGASAGDTSRPPADAPQGPPGSSDAQAPRGSASAPVPNAPRSPASDGQEAVPPTAADPAWPMLIQRAETGLLAALPLVAIAALAAFDVSGPRGAEIAAVVALIAFWGAFGAAPRAAWVATRGSIGALLGLAAFGLLDFVLPPETPVVTSFLLLAACVGGAYLGSVVLAVHDWPVRRPWLSAPGHQP